MSILKYGDREPSRNTSWESEAGTLWYHDGGTGWGCVPGETGWDWEDLAFEDFPMTEVTR